MPTRFVSRPDARYAARVSRVHGALLPPGARFRERLRTHMLLAMDIARSSGSTSVTRDHVRIAASILGQTRNGF